MLFVLYLCVSVLLLNILRKQNYTLRNSYKSKRIHRALRRGGNSFREFSIPFIVDKRGEPMRTQQSSCSECVMWMALINDVHDNSFIVVRMLGYGLAVFMNIEIG